VAHSLKVAQLLRSAACLHTNQSRSYLNHLVQVFSSSGDMLIKKQYISSEIITASLQGTKHVASIVYSSNCQSMFGLTGLIQGCHLIL